MANFVPAGIQSDKYYELISKALQFGGYASIEEFMAQAPEYWNDEKHWMENWALSAYANPYRTFEQRIGNAYRPVMATYLTDEADEPIIANEGFELNSDEMPRMGQALIFDRKTIEETEILNIAYGEKYGRILDSFRCDSAKLINAIHSQRSFTGDMIEFTGKWTATSTNNQGGVTMQVDFKVPSDNKKKCGGFQTSGISEYGTKNAWSSSSASPIGDLRDMFYWGKTHHLIDAMPERSVFRMTEATYYVIRNHADTKRQVALWKSGYLIDSNNIQYFQVTDEDLAAYLRSLGLPSISTSKYNGFIEYLDTDNMTIKKSPIAAGTNSVLLRPAGKVGEIQWKKVSNIFDTVNTPTYYSEGGAIAMQEVRADRRLGVKFAVNSICLPVPYAVQRMIYLDTTQAAD